MTDDQARANLMRLWMIGLRSRGEPVARRIRSNQTWCFGNFRITVEASNWREIKSFIVWWTNPQNPNGYVYRSPNSGVRLVPDPGFDESVAWFVGRDKIDEMIKELEGLLVLDQLADV